MEEGFSQLLERIGYRIVRKRDPKSGLDIIADFDGKPVPSPADKCCLKKPVYAPNGMTAFSLKRGDFSKGDIQELIEKTTRAKKLGDPVLSKLSGCVMVTNHTKTEAQLDDLLSQSVYCWDIRRLILYSVKAKQSFDMASRGPVREYSLERVENSSVLVHTGETIGSSAITVNIAVFVDDHNPELNIDGAYINSVLFEIYEKSLKPYVDSTDLDVQALLRFHLLGIADENVLINTYNQYARNASHARVTFSAAPIIFQYGATPWRPLFQF